MKEAALSIFIDESGDFGPFSPHSPYYIVSLVCHNQKIDISPNIQRLDTRLQYYGVPNHCIHTGPLIRREGPYKYYLREDRQHLFNAIFHFARQLPFTYHCILLKKASFMKKETFQDVVDHAIDRLTKEAELEWNQFERVIVYYDNGQSELNKAVHRSLESLSAKVEFRMISPDDYKLFQVADLICTLEMIHEKASSGSMSSSEIEFFLSKRDFTKNYWKPLRKKCGYMICNY